MTAPRQIRDHASFGRRMRQLELVQRETSAALQVRHRASDAGCSPSQMRKLRNPPTVVALLQRERAVNASQLTDMHVALAFVRNRYRRHELAAVGPILSTQLPEVPYWVARYARCLLHGLEPVPADALQAQYVAWSAWSNARDNAVSKPEMQPWQVAYRKREKAPKNAARRARRGAAGVFGKGEFLQPTAAEVRP